MYALAYDGPDQGDEEDQIPETENPAFILGHAYSCLYGMFTNCASLGETIVSPSLLTCRPPRNT